MNTYPRLAHVAAALVGVALHSTLLGMQVVALGSLALVWGAFVLMLYSLPRRAAGAAALVLALLLFVNHTWLDLPVHGAEIVSNYFYSQLVAQALAMLALALAIWLDQYLTRWHAYALLFAALYVVESTHLLPAIELLGVLAGLLLLDVLSPSKRKGALVPGVVLLVAGVALVILHPTFGVMRGIANNDGALTLVGFAGMGAIALLCAGTLAVSGCLLLAWWRDPARLPVRKYLAVYGAVLAGLCLLQIALVYMHAGSGYAVKKYVFGLLSFVFVALAALIGPLLAGTRTAAPPAGGGALPLTGLRAAAASNTLACMLFALSASLVAGYAANGHKAFDVSDAVAIERQLIALHDTVLPAPATGQSDVVVDLPGLPPALGYMFSLGILHVPRDPAMRANFTAEQMGPVMQYASIVTGRDQGRYGAFGSCSRTAGGLMVLDSGCLQKAIAAASVCKGMLDFGAAGKVGPSMLTGFSNAEAGYRWTEGHTSTVTCKVDQPYRTAQLQIAPFLTPGHQHQRAGISVNGGPVVNVEFTGDSAVRLVDVPLPASVPGTEFVFTITTPDAVSPQQLGLSTDARVLGIAVHTLTFH
jgi:hypothetical protein